MTGKISFHERFDRQEKTDRSPDRSFCLMFSCIFAVFAFLAYRHAHAVRETIFALSCAAFLTVAVIKPSLAAPLNRAWMQLGHGLARVTNPLLLALIYVTTIIPIGWLMRRCGKDPLRRARDPVAASYWIVRQPPGPAPESMSNQF